MKIKLSRLDKKIINYLSAQILEGLEPFHTVAARLNIRPEEVFKKIIWYKKLGILRKFGAALNHRQAGFKFNVMGVWVAPPHKIKAAAKIMISYPQVSHCYQRKTYPDWPYNLYTMIHAQKKTDCLRIIKAIAKKTKIKEYKLLFSQEEYKKQSRIYFDE